MKKILVTGGTTFVSKYVAEYFVNVGYEVFVLNRNSKPQVQGVKLIEGDRHNLGGVLKDTFFDVVADITAYNDNDIIDFVREFSCNSRQHQIQQHQCIAMLLHIQKQLCLSSGKRLLTGIACFG